MNNYRRLVTGILCLLFLLSITACKVPMPGRVLLTTPPSSNARTPVAAVGADGTRHFAWTEQVGIKQGMVYARAYPDGRFYQAIWSSPTSGTHYGNPDLVVTDNGIAYLSYTAINYDGTPGGIWSAHYSAFPAGWLGTTPLVYSAGVGERDLKLVQRGNTVYVLGYASADDTSSSITYKQLYGAIRQGLVAWEDGWFATVSNAVIDAAGDLHVAFRSYYHIGTDDRIGYASNVGSLGDMAAPVYETVSAGFPAPSIARAEETDDIFVAYAVQGTPSDSLYVWRPHPAPATGPVSRALGPATNWSINGSPAIVATGTNYYQVIFSASNSASADTEIWTYGSSSSSPYQVTNDTVGDGPPVAARIIGDFNGSPVEFPMYAWRTTYLDPGPPPTTCYGNVKVVADGSLAPHPRTIFQNKALTCANPGYDLAVNGDRGLGVWLDIRDGSSILEPWYSVDGVEVFIPAIRK